MVAVQGIQAGDGAISANRKLGTVLAKGAGRGQAKRAAILKAASDLFIEVGYGRASMNMLVDRVGGSKATLYAHFPGKVSLFEAVVDEILGEVVAANEGLKLDGLSFRQGLTHAGEVLLELVLSDRHVGLARLVIAEARQFPDIGRIYYEHGPSLAYLGLVAFFETHAADTEFHIPDPRRSAKWFAGMLLHGEFMQRLCVGGAVLAALDLRASVEAVVEAVLELHRVRLAK